MSKSNLQDAIDTAISDATEGMVRRDDVDKAVAAGVKEWMDENLVEFVDRAIAQMLATPKGAKKAGQRAPGHNHRGRCGAKCFAKEEETVDQ